MSTTYKLCDLGQDSVFLYAIRDSVFLITSLGFCEYQNYSEILCENLPYSCQIEKGNVNYQSLVYQPTSEQMVFKSFSNLESFRIFEIPVNANGCFKLFMFSGTSISLALHSFQQLIANGQILLYCDRCLHQIVNQGNVLNFRDDSLAKNVNTTIGIVPILMHNQGSCRVEHFYLGVISKMFRERYWYPQMFWLMIYVCFFLPYFFLILPLADQRFQFIQFFLSSYPSLKITSFVLPISSKLSSN